MQHVPLTRGAGVGFKPQHFAELINDTSRIDLLEIHAENYFGDGGILHHQLERLHALLPLSIHGVGLSVGGAAPLDAAHLAQLRHLCERHPPALVSEHLAWAGDSEQFLADLLPIAYTPEVLNRTVDHVAQLQDTLGRRVLIENPATYLTFAHSAMPEAEFLAELVQRSGCGLLLDLNNLRVSCHNNGGDVDAYLQRLNVANANGRIVDLEAYRDLMLSGDPQAYPDLLLSTSQKTGIATFALAAAAYLIMRKMPSLRVQKTQPQTSS